MPTINIESDTKFFDTVDCAKQFVADNYPDLILVKEDEQGVRYHWGGYPEGFQLFIIK
jgi:hypothetical protein